MEKAPSLNSYKTERPQGLYDAMSHERRIEIQEKDILVSREEFGYDIMNNFYLYFYENPSGDAWIEDGKREGWFNRYLETHQDQFELLRERLTRAHQEAKERVGNYGNYRDRGGTDYFGEIDETFLPILDSVMDEMYDQYVGMYNSITDEDLKHMWHNTRVKSLGH